MKNIFVLLVSIFLISSSTLAQLDKWVCATDSCSPRTTRLLDYDEGRYTTSHGSLPVLVVFVSFPGDPDHARWPENSPPTGYLNSIDYSPSQGSTNPENLTHFFRVTSMEEFIVVGYPYWVEAPQPRAWYDNNNYSRFQINADVIQNSIDPILDFSPYDQWSRNGYYNHINTPDGIVDMIALIYKGMPFSNYWTGEASLDYGGYVNVDNGQRSINTNYRHAIGGGFNVQFDYLNYNLTRVMLSAAHELSHYLLDRFHPYGFVKDYSIYSILGDPFTGGVCPNTYDRDVLGWTEPIEITSTDLIGEEISDFLTTGVSYKYHPPNGAADEYIYIENHQKISVYDNATRNTSDKGIFILHSKQAYSNTNSVRIVTSDGLQDWDVAFMTQHCFGMSLPAFKSYGWDINGQFHRSKIIYGTGQEEWMWVYAEGGVNEECGGFAAGYGMIGTYNQNSNTVFSNWSNPASTTWDGLSTYLSMDVLDVPGPVIHANMYVDDIEGEGFPAVPRNFTLANVDDSPYLTWDSNTEPDLRRYRLYRLNGDPNIFIVTGTSYHDTEVKISPKGNIVNYKVKAEDWAGNLSAYSNQASTPGILGKELVHSTPHEYSLQNNYPNPFNPTTSINYSLAKQSSVSIKVYDITGAYVITLVDEYMNQGWKTTQWSGRNSKGRPVPSGMYIFQLIANSTDGKDNIVASRKMVLLR